MKGGHNIKPARQKIAEGTSRKSRDASRVELQMPPALSSLDPPEYFDERHRKKFRECCRLMSDAGVLQPQDFDAIVKYTEAWWMSHDAFLEIQENGATLWVETAGGTKPITNPAFRQYQDCQKILKPLMEQFAFTPRARMGIKVDPADRKPKEDSPVMKLLKSRTGTDG